MNLRTFLTMTVVVTLAIVMVRTVEGQENVQTITQGLAGGAVVDSATQERLTLVTLSTGCSGSLLRNSWVITAAHCVDDRDPVNKDRFIQVKDDSVTVTGAWPTQQVRKSMRIITFRPNDIAIIRVDSPFKLNGSTTNFIRDIFRDGQFPYFGTTVPVPIAALGRGINTFARPGGANGVPTSGDDQYRVGYFITTREDGTLYWYPSTAGQHIAGGDSGGPSFAKVRGTDTVLMGVHALCKTRCLEGKICGEWRGPEPEPAGYSRWMWVADTTECADSIIAPVWDDINRYLGAFVPQGGDDPEGPPISPIAPPGPTIVPSFIYGIDGRGGLQWYRHDGAREGTGFQTSGSWQGARSVGRGWEGMKWVFPGGGNVIYAITADGTLKWYQHNGFNTGVGLESSTSWNVTKDVGRGWGDFNYVFAGGEGVIYGIQPDGTLRWHRHLAYQTGQGLETQGAWANSRSVGRGWTDYKHVFSGGHGIIYVITNDGTLRWHRHKAYLTGEGLETPGSWEGPKNVGRGWGDVQQVFSPGDGIIYAVMADGTLRWSRHIGYLDGRGFETAGAWEGPKNVGRGWALNKIFALLPRAPDVIR